MKVKIKYLLAILLGLLFLWDVFLTTANRFITPLESSSLTPSGKKILWVVLLTSNHLTCVAPGSSDLDHTTYLPVILSN